MTKKYAAEIDEKIINVIVSVVCKNYRIEVIEIKRRNKNTQARFLISYLIHNKWNGSADIVSKTLGLSDKSHTYIYEARDYIEELKADSLFIKRYIIITDEIEKQLGQKPLSNSDTIMLENSLISEIPSRNGNSKQDKFKLLLDAVWTTCHTSQTLTSFKAVGLVTLSRDIAIFLAFESLEFSLDTLMDKFNAGESEVFTSLGKIRYYCKSSSDHQHVKELVDKISTKII